MVRCVVSAPVDVYAGYGARSVDFVKALQVARPDWHIEVLSQAWGNCRFGYLEEHDEWEIRSMLTSHIDYTPDVWIQITVPNEFQRVGKFNIGVTAGIETTMAPGDWVEGCNRMDLVLTSSKHGKFSLVNPVYQNRVTGETVRTDPAKIKVLFEGIDREKYFHINRRSKLLKGLKSNWNFLYVGHWLPGNLGEDRKNTGYTLKMFLDTFKDTPNAPGLIMKTSRAAATEVDKAELVRIMNRIRDGIEYETSLPPVYLLHGDLSDEEMNEVYNDPRVKAMVSFTKGEGYGRPLAEFASIGKPILTSAWSGHTDFLDPKCTALVGGTLRNVHPSAANNMLLTTSQWFYPDDQQVVAGFKTIYKDYKKWLAKAQEQERYIVECFSTKTMASSLDVLLQGVENGAPGDGYKPFKMPN